MADGDTFASAEKNQSEKLALGIFLLGKDVHFVTAS